jgi:hypothetical protein
LLESFDLVLHFVTLLTDLLLLCYHVLMSIWLYKFVSIFVREFCKYRMLFLSLHLNHLLMRKTIRSQVDRFFCRPRSLSMPPKFLIEWGHSPFSSTCFLSHGMITRHLYPLSISNLPTVNILAPQWVANDLIIFLNGRLS